MPWINPQGLAQFAYALKLIDCTSRIAFVQLNTKILESDNHLTVTNQIVDTCNVLFGQEYRKFPQQVKEFVFKIECHG